VGLHLSSMPAKFIGITIPRLLKCQYQIPVSSTYRKNKFFIDIVGPPSKGFKYLLQLTDLLVSSKPFHKIVLQIWWRRCFSLTEQPDLEVYAWHNWSEQFEAQLFDALTKLVGSKRTTTYHSESNDIIELWYRSSKTVLMCHGETQWTDTLLVVLFGLRICFSKRI